MIQGLQLGMDKVRQFSYQLGRGLFVRDLKEIEHWEDVRNWTGGVRRWCTVGVLYKGVLFPCKERLAMCRADT